MVELSLIRDIVAIFGVIAGFIYYVLTVRATHITQKHQLETRQAQLYLGIYGMISNLVGDFLVIYPELRKITSYREFLDKFPSDSEGRKTFRQWQRLMGMLGYYVYHDYIPVDMVAHCIGNTYFNSISDWVDEYRKYAGAYTAESWQWLSDRLDEIGEIVEKGQYRKRIFETE